MRRLSSRTMPGPDTMEPLERLLNLVGLLLETPTPLTFDQIRETLDAYQGDNLDSIKRKFERDKDMLRAYGVPLEMTGTDAWDVEQGYIIRKDRYYLPAVTGVRKLLYGAEGGILTGSGGGPLAMESDTDQDRLMAAAGAASDRHAVRFGYRTAQGAVSERTVDAFGVVFRTGRWYLVGHDRERDAVRAFRLSRVISELTDAGPGIDPPEGFVAIDHIDAAPRDATDLPVARVAFTSEAAVLAEGNIAGASRERVREDGWVVLRLPATDPDTLGPLVLGYGPEAEVLEPPTLRADVIGRLEAVTGG